MSLIALTPWLAPLLAQAEGESPLGIFGSPMFPILITLAGMYFLWIRPEQQKRKEHEKHLGGLKKNDQVVTTGGIVGTVVNASPGSPYVVVRVDENTNTRLRILRSAILQIGGLEEGSEKTSGESPAE